MLYLAFILSLIFKSKIILETWIITDGLCETSAEYFGMDLHGIKRKTLIGIVPWGIVRGTELFEGEHVSVIFYL